MQVTVLNKQLKRQQQERMLELSAVLGAQVHLQQQLLQRSVGWV
jgi:hypothetical protein